MADMMSTGLSGLLAFRRALDTTGHNIANANTDGYSRQRVEFGTREATQLGSGYIGNGVKVLSVRRSVDEFLTTQARGSASGLERLQAFASQAERINNLFSDGDEWPRVQHAEVRQRDRGRSFKPKFAGGPAGLVRREPVSDGPAEIL